MMHYGRHSTSDKSTGIQLPCVVHSTTKILIRINMIVCLLDAQIKNTLLKYNVCFLIVHDVEAVFKVD